MTPKPPIRAQRLWRTVGDRVRAAREDANLSAVALSLAARITRQALFLIEHGRRGTRLETLYRIAKATGKPIGYFLPAVDDA